MGGRSRIIAACKVRRGWLQRVQHLDSLDMGLQKGGMVLEFGKTPIINDASNIESQILNSPWSELSQQTGTCAYRT